MSALKLLMSHQKVKLYSVDCEAWCDLSPMSSYDTAAPLTSPSYTRQCSGVLSIAVTKYSDQKQLGGYISLQFTTHHQGKEVDTMGECCLPSCSPCLTQLPSL